MVLYAAADCTGHGVPGAFVSMIGSNGLKETVTEYGIREPGKILDKVTNIVEETFVNRKDGMDIALCKVNSKKGIVEFAGAFNPLYIVRNNEILIYEADRMPIGIYDFEGAGDKFTNNEIKLLKGDSLYTFSDGYSDQFGGPRDKKFMIGRFKKMLLQIQNLSMEEQRQFLDDTIERWMENYEQVDDILVIGTKF